MKQIEKIDYMIKSLEVAKDEIKQLVEEELENYKKEKKKFYDNPLHWTNGKRRMNGLRPLRGKTNKTRLKKYPQFKLSFITYSLIEDLLNKTLVCNMKDNFL